MHRPPGPLLLRRQKLAVPSGPPVVLESLNEGLSVLPRLFLAPVPPLALRARFACLVGASEWIDAEGALLRGRLRLPLRAPSLLPAPAACERVRLATFVASRVSVSLNTVIDLFGHFSIFCPARRCGATGRKQKLLFWASKRQKLYRAYIGVSPVGGLCRPKRVRALSTQAFRLDSRNLTRVKSGAA